MRHQINSIEFPQVRCNNLIAGITAVIGIIGGILLITKTTKYYICKITEKRNKDPDEYENICNVCCLDINQKDDKTFVKSTLCKRNICRRSKCASLSPKSCNWKCELCKTSEESLAQTSSWVADQISLHQNKVDYPPKARSEIYIPISEYNDSSMRFESASQILSNSTTVTDEQKFRIRQYVEEIVSEILDGNLDTIPISQLSKSENYLQTSKVAKKITKYMSCGIDTPNLNEVSEEGLRQLIQKIIAETINLPLVLNNHTVSETTLDTTTKIPLNNGCYQRHQREKYFEPKAYQDLLATAVLNKVVDKQLSTKEDDKEFKHGTQSDESNFQRVDIRHGEKDLENNSNIENLSTTSGSSVEPESDCSYTPMENIINANEEQSFELLHNMDSHMRVVSLPDLMDVPTESEDDYMSVTSSAIGDGTWENNWLFKKKKHNSSGSATFSSVGMLVPDPTDDIRAQIGDKTADEVSDLSELGSDTDDSLDILQSKLIPIGDRFISKHLIGGATYKLRLEEIVDREQLYTDTINEHVFDAPTKNEAVHNNVYNQQKKEVQDNNYDIIVPKSIDANSNSLEGSIAEREYKKWYNAVEMPNNPYAPEALKRRISGSQERFIDLPNISPIKELNTLNLFKTNNSDSDDTQNRENDCKRYSRDYYINSNSPSSQSTPVKEFSPHKDIYEVNNKHNNKKHTYENMTDNITNTKQFPDDSLCTLSNPVRRSSSLKLFKNNIASLPPLHLNDYLHHQQHSSSSILQYRPSTSNSNHRQYDNTKIISNIGKPDTYSQQSMNTVSDISRKHPKSISILSTLSNNSSKSSHSSYIISPDHTVLQQFEKQLLHKDLKRNSFRAVTSTTKDFVLNPLYEKNGFCNNNKKKHT